MDPSLSPIRLPYLNITTIGSKVDLITYFFASVSFMKKPTAMTLIGHHPLTLVMSAVLSLVKTDIGIELK